ncbi:uncharacterized protein LOC142224042 [Haematobia irritans]|uniref:uncharacterized protein LOC142224042 n=1 Tax=Haematobia irritans TaxID=7368 RepID=UPI003F4FCE55
MQLSWLTYFTLALMGSVQVVLSNSYQGSNEISDLQNTKRYKLISFINENLRMSIWPQELYPKMWDYLSDVKNDDDVDMPKSSLNYGEIQQTLGNCLKHLRYLKEDPNNCEHQKSLKANHDRLKALIKTHGSPSLQQMWTSKYIDFTLQMRNILRNASEKFYRLLALSVDSFIKSLDEVEEYEEVDILRWNDKFLMETDIVKKQILLIELMGLFADERNILELECKIQYANFL